MKLGVEVFIKNYLSDLEGKRLGLVTNITGVNQELESTVDVLYKNEKIQLKALFAPEHGIRSSAAAGEKVDSYIDEFTKLPVYSLYGSQRKPSPEMLENIDIMVFDIQDIGSRYYTYIYTMAYVMEACRDINIPIFVLDRPNPIGGIAQQGNIVKEEFRSFVGNYPIPNRHGMTIGELAQMFNDEFGINCNLTVVKMDGWSRDSYYDDYDLIWIPPSPNVTTVDMCILYAGTCFIEGTNLSEGRGTSYPFQILGAPFIDGNELAKRINELNFPGLITRSYSFVPTTSKFKDELCQGIFIHVTDRQLAQPLQLVLKALEIINTMHPEKFEFIQNENGKFFFDLLAGDACVRKMINESRINNFFNDLESIQEEFSKLSYQYFMY